MKQLLHHAGSRWAVALLFEPRDVWVGVYWDPYDEYGYRWVSLYVCLIPVFPIRIDLRARDRRP